jgi:hypothetical protein
LGFSPPGSLCASKQLPFNQSPITSPLSAENDFSQHFSKFHSPIS